MTVIRIAKLAWPVTVLGPGRRAVVWVQGCDIGCPACASKDTWDRDGGEERSIDDVMDWLLGLPERPDGLTVSGGEPFQQPRALAELIERVRRWADDVDILVFSGYTRARLERDADLRPVLESCDAAVAGPYLPRRGFGGWLRGSANQELVLNTDLARRRFASPERGPSLQVQVSGERVDMIGIPKPGDLDRLAANLGDRGWKVGDATWRQ